MIETLGSGVINRCFLCDRTSDRIVWHENGVDGRLCDCGMLYSDTGGRVISPMDVAIELHHESFYSAPAQFKADWMAARCPRRGRLLEVGCGEPSFLAAARAMDYQIAAMEPHPGRADLVSNRLGVDVERAFIEEDTLPAGSFDIVYHCDLLVHFPDPLKALASMVRLLKPGGVLCFEVGILGGISPFWYRLIRQIELGPHLFLYSHRALDVLLDRAGLEVLHRTEFGLAPEVLLHAPIDVFARRVLGSILPAERVDAFRRRAEFWTRYRLSRLAPRVGPATLLFVARPKVGR